LTQNYKISKLSDITSIPKFQNIFNIEISKDTTLFEMATDLESIGLGGWITLSPGHYRMFIHIERGHLFSQDHKDFVLFLESNLGKLYEGEKNVILWVDDLSLVGFHGSLGWKKIKKISREKRYKLGKTI